MSACQGTPGAPAAPPPGAAVTAGARARASPPGRARAAGKGPGKAARFAAGGWGSEAWVRAKEADVDVIIVIGRILFVPLFLSSAVGHLTRTDSMAGYARSKGLPAANLAVVASGILFGLGALSVLLGVWPDLGALVIFLTLVPTAVLMHAFWREDDPQTRYLEQVQFLKDLSLAGAALALFGLFARYGDDVGLTVTGPLFG